MRQFGRWQKILGFLALAVLGLLLAPFVAVQIQQWIFRHRAEDLLADMRTLMMHRGNPTKILAISKRWDADGDPCSAQDCRLEILLTYGSFSEIDYCQDATDWRSRWLRLFRMYGGRLAFVRARAFVEHGVVGYASFEIGMENFLHPKDAYDYYCTKRPEGLEGWLSGLAASVSRFSIENDWRGLTLHPNYLIEIRSPRQGDTPPPTVDSLFGPHAEPADVGRLATFNLSCLTRLVPCREPRDLMPEAAAQFAREEPKLAQARMDHACGPAIVGLMAHDAGRAGVVEVTGNHAEHDLGTWGVVSLPTVRLIQEIKPASDWKIGESHELLILDANTDRPVTKFPPEVYPGNRFIVLAESGIFSRWVRTERCGIVPLNPTNLKLVREAIAGNLPPAKP
jgi:hypothetical protein